jgi:PAS domain S-box-containing protein
VDASVGFGTSEDRLRTILELTKSFTFLVDLTQDGSVQVERVSDGFTRDFGYTVEDMTALGGALAIVHPEDLSLAAGMIEALVAGEQVRAEVRAVASNGSARWVEVYCATESGPDGEGSLRLFGVGQDVTEQVQARHALERAQEERLVLLERLVEAHAEERVRLARELHDGLGQILTSASLYATSIEPGLPASLVASLATLRGQLEEALAATRTLVWRLRPVELDERGLAGAVVTLAEKIRQRHGFQVDVHISGLDERLPAPAESAVYRVVQEAVTNAVKHANPQTISIVITRRKSAVVAVVEDDGAGFALDELVGSDDESGFGIVGMRERAASLGGQLVIESRPGNGAMVRLEVPCEGAAPT